MPRRRGRAQARAAPRRRRPVDGSAVGRRPAGDGRAARPRLGPDAGLPEPRAAGPDARRRRAPAPPRPERARRPAAPARPGPRTAPAQARPGVRRRAAARRPRPGRPAPPRTLFADEPTSRLDLITQEETVRCLMEQIAQRNCALVLVTHDQALVDAACDRRLAVGDHRLAHTRTHSPAVRPPAPASFSHHAAGVASCRSATCSSSSTAGSSATTSLVASVAQGPRHKRPLRTHAPSLLASNVFVVDRRLGAAGGDDPLLLVRGLNCASGHRGGGVPNSTDCTSHVSSLQIACSWSQWPDLGRLHRRVRGQPRSSVRADRAAGPPRQPERRPGSRRSAGPGHETTWRSALSTARSASPRKRAIASRERSAPSVPFGGSKPGGPGHFGCSPRTVRTRTGRPGSRRAAGARGRLCRVPSLPRHPTR